MANDIAAQEAASGFDVLMGGGRKFWKGDRLVNRSEMMAAVRSKNTKPEMLVRRLLHGYGYRYRLHRADLPGRPDLVFPARKKIIFVHGCFWHRHPRCPFSHVPKSNVAYWAPKLRKNKARDRRHLKALQLAGWRCLVLWECELGNPKRILNRARKFLGP